MDLEADSLQLSTLKELVDRHTAQILPSLPSTAVVSTEQGPGTLIHDSQSYTYKTAARTMVELLQT